MFYTKARKFISVCIILCMLAAVAPSVVFGATATITISPTSWNVSATGGNTTINVSVSSGAAWTAVAPHNKPDGSYNDGYGFLTLTNISNSTFAHPAYHCIKENRV